MERLDYRKMASSEVQENFVELRVLGQKSIMKKPIVRRANKKETWQDFLQNTCGLQVSKKDGIYVRTVLSSTRLRRSDGEKYGWTAELDDKIGTFIGKFWLQKKKNTVYLLRKRQAPNQGGGKGVNSPLPLLWYLPNKPASSSSEQVPEEIDVEDDHVRRVTLEKVEICSDSEDSEQEADDTLQLKHVNPKTESTSDVETEMEYERRNFRTFSSSDSPLPVVELDNENRKEGDAGNGQEGDMSFGSSDPLLADPPRVRVKQEWTDAPGSGMTGDRVNWDSCSSTTSRHEDDENPSFFTSFPRFSSQRPPMPACSMKDVAKKELERCSNGYLSKIKHELEDLKARNMWEGIEDKSPLAYRLLEDLFKV